MVGVSKNCSGLTISISFMQLQILCLIKDMFFYVYLSALEGALTKNSIKKIWSAKIAIMRKLLKTEIVKSLFID